ncbi:MAG: hypothetical protein ACKVJ6_05335 [Flavobacteriales bacterium]
MKNSVSLCFISLVFSSLALLSCERGSKTIEPTNAQPSNETGIFFGNAEKKASRSEFSTQDSPKDSPNSSYKITAVEILQSSKYSYLKVEGEGDELNTGNAYWIATLKGDFTVGGDYTYSGRLLKTDFESKEFNRSFDKIYLVSFIEGVMVESESEVESESRGALTTNRKLMKSEIDGITTISELLGNPTKFAGTRVTVIGQIAKVNEGIMDRNWIHLKDGSADDFDFILTSDVLVQVGQTVTFEGLITTHKDFGSGYFYDLIMEEAVPIK